jgi:hypothetical protein
LKQIAKLIKAEVKDKFPNIKVSVKTQHYSGGRSLDVKITDFNGEHFLKKKVIYPEMANLPESQIPRYAYGWEYLPSAKAVIEGIERVGNQYNYDRSDSQTDLYDVNFSFDVDFSWNLFQAEERRIGLIEN